MALPNKLVVVEVPASREPERPLQVLPGMTVEQALQELGMSPELQVLRSPDNKGVLDRSENLYRIAREGDRLSVSPKLDAGMA